MSFINTNSLRIVGGTPSDIGVTQAAGPTNANVSQGLNIGVHRRPFMGPKIGGHYSLHLFVDIAGGAGSNATIYYSNHPNPSTANDNDWELDATIAPLDLTVTGSYFLNVGNVFPEWIMLRMDVQTSIGNFRCFVRTEGTTVGKTG